MPRHFEKRVLPYTAQQMFDLVADVARYPEFLPWCRASAVEPLDERRFKADLTVGTKTFRDSFTSFVTLDPTRAITVEYGGGPLAFLHNDWHFIAAPGGCEVTFLVDFKMKSRLLGAMMDLFFEAAFGRMVAAFEARAKELYGNKA